MLAIVLTILKIIGIIILCLVLTVLVVAGLILFVPIRYRSSGYYHEDYAVNGKLSWLFHLITVRLLFQKESDLQLVVRVLGIPVYDMQKKKHKEARKKEKSHSDVSKATRKKVSSEETVEKNQSDVNKSKQDMQKFCSDDVVDTEAAKENVETQIPITESEDEFNSAGDIPKGFSFGDKWNAVLDKWKQRISNIKCTYKRICDKIEKIRDNITYYSDLLQEENTKEAFSACKKELFRIWKDIKPKRFKINALLGFEDPATTGQIVGYCAMLYPLHLGNIVVVPEFEEKVLKLDFELKGKVTVYVYLIVAYTVLFNKNIRRLKKCLLREDS